MDSWHIGLPSDIQRNTLEWAGPVLRSLAICRGEYIKNGISTQLAEVTVTISHVRRGYLTYLWRGGLTTGSEVFGRSQAAQAGKWIRAHITSAETRPNSMATSTQTATAGETTASEWEQNKLIGKSIAHHWQHNGGRFQTNLMAARLGVPAKALRNYLRREERAGRIRNLGRCGWALPKTPAKATSRARS